MPRSLEKCLRNHYNQYFHEQLQRGLARDFLAEALDAAGHLLF